MFLDINKNIEGIKIKLNLLEQDIENKMLEKKDILLDAANLDKEQQTILRTEFEGNFILELKTMRDGTVKDVIQPLYN